MPVLGSDARPVSGLIDRMMREFLEPADDQPTRFTLAAELAEDATSLSYDPALLSPEEEDILGPGMLIEVGIEEIVVGAVDASTNVLSSLIRGANGTEPALHAVGGVAKVMPTWRRRAAFDAVCDAIDALFPELYAVDTIAVSAGTGSTTEIPAAVAWPLWMWDISGARHDELTFLDHYGGSSTGKALMNGVTGHLVYAKSFERPDSEDVDLADLSIDPAWERLVIVSAVSYLMSGREADPIAQKFLTEQQAQQGFPVGSATRLRDALIREYEYLLAKAKRQLRSRYPITVARGW
ncbi:MAG TPA: hypothetical protein VM938_10650 [Acidimicrobiales bacterium]|nr:hypothetical protein [Acidimicrobiales bacterium]